LLKRSQHAAAVALIALAIAFVGASAAYAATPGYYIAGDGSGGGGCGGSYYMSSQSATGGAGGGGSDSLLGTSGDDVIFGDGSGGGGGGIDYHSSQAATGGAGGGGADTIDAGSGNDIMFGDGFDGGAGIAMYGDAGAGGFGGGGGGGAGEFIIHVGAGGAGGVLGGGGGGVPVGASLWGGLSGGPDSKPASGTASYDGMWGGNSATPTAGGGWFGERSFGGSAYGSTYYVGGGGAGFGGENTALQSINASDTRGANGGTYGEDSGQPGSTTPVRYDDSTGALWTYVDGQLANIFSSAGGTTDGVGNGTDTLDGGPGSDELFGLGGNDTFVFERSDAGASDVDTIWDFNRLGESDKLRLSIGGQVIGSAARDALVASQVTSGTDRMILFADGGSHSTTVTVKGVNRDLVAGDFVDGGRVTQATSAALSGVSRVRKGHRYSLTTTLNPRSTPGFVRFTIQRYKGGRWVKVRTASMWLTSGRAVYRFYPYYRGNWKITAAYPGVATAGTDYLPSSATKRFGVY
jgi:Ca2+-binding RTX toxin-like protein